MENEKVLSASQKMRLLLIGNIIFVVVGIASGLLNIAWTYMKDDFGVELDSLGILLFFGTLGSLIAAFSSGALIGRFRLGFVLLGGALVATLGLLGYALSPVWIVLLFIAFLYGNGQRYPGCRAE